MEAPGQTIPRGYHLRLDGAVFNSMDPVKCDCCGRWYHSLVGIEFNYPDNPDMYICGQCWEEHERETPQG